MIGLLSIVATCVCGGGEANPRVKEGLSELILKFLNIFGILLKGYINKYLVSKDFSDFQLSFGTKHLYTH
jgi:hypothetical protein